MSVNTVALRGIWFFNVEIQTDNGSGRAQKAQF